MKKILIFVSIISIAVANDMTDIENLINKQWKANSDKNWKEYVSTMHSGGTMNGDSNGSFWYRTEASVKAVTANNSPSDRYNFKPRYLEIDMLVTGKAAAAYYYLVGSYTINGVTKNDYRTRVSQVLVTEEGKWKIKAGHFTPLHSGSGIPD